MEGWFRINCLKHAISPQAKMNIIHLPITINSINLNYNFSSQVKKFWSTGAPTRDHYSQVEILEQGQMVLCRFTAVVFTGTSTDCHYGYKSDDTLVSCPGTGIYLPKYSDCYMLSRLWCFVNPKRGAPCFNLTG